jgi:hypothetical protein
MKTILIVFLCFILYGCKKDIVTPANQSGNNQTSNNSVDTIGNCVLNYSNFLGLDSIHYVEKESIDSNVYSLAYINTVYSKYPSSGEISFISKTDTFPNESTAWDSIEVDFSFPSRPTKNGTYYTYNVRNPLDTNAIFYANFFEGCQFNTPSVYTNSQYSNDSSHIVTVDSVNVTVNNGKLTIKTSRMAFQLHDILLGNYDIILSGTFVEH